MLERAAASESQSNGSSTRRNVFFFSFFFIFLVACTPVPSRSPEPPFVACTADAKICPDGSAVGRVGPNCEFALCPDRGKSYCDVVEDCVCDGIDPETGNCFVGNRAYYDFFVDKERQCADFCTGIDGRLQTACVENKCVLVRGEPPEVKPYVELSAEPAVGEAPLKVHFVAKLRGAEPNDERFYCVGITWDFGVGQPQTLLPGCVPYSPDLVIPIRFEGDYFYEKPGVYDVSFTLGDVRSNAVKVVALPELLPPECDEDSDCVPAQCCHAADCIIREKRPDCSKMMCTQECRSGTIDCGGSCGCVAGRCTGQNFYKGETTATGKIPWQLI